MIGERYLVEQVGMPLKVAQGVALLQELWPNDDGPAHIVLADYNLRWHDLLWCVKEIDKGETYTDSYGAGHPVFSATRAALMWLLLEVDEKERTEWELYPVRPPTARH